MVQAKECAKLKRKDERCVMREDTHRTSDGGEVLLLRYPLLEDTGIVKHCFTTRIGGVSEGVCASMNLSFSRGDKKEAVEQNFRRLAEAMDVDYEKFVFTDQTHTVNVRKVTVEDAGKGLRKERDYADVDGLITDVPGLTLSTFYADCVPLYFVDPVHRAIGMSHSGWRGTVAHMGKVTLEAMRDAYGTMPEDVICAVGPSICQDCYEVSGDVAEAFVKEFPGHEAEILADSPKNRVSDEAKKDAAETKEAENSAAMPEQEGKKYQLNLWRANEIVLLEAGVLPEHIAVTNICTCCNPDLLFSHRASHGKRGNLGGFLCLRE